MTLVEFLMARLDEIEARHEANWWNECDRCHDHAPCWAMRDAEGKRRIVAKFVALDTHPNRLAYAFMQQQWVALCAVIAALALPYADHPDYDEDWRPASG